MTVEEFVQSVILVVSCWQPASCCPSAWWRSVDRVTVRYGLPTRGRCLYLMKPGRPEIIEWAYMRSLPGYQGIYR